MDVVMELITNVGFPIGITVYLLFRDSTTIKALTDSINNNTLSLSLLIEKLERGSGGN